VTPAGPEAVRVPLPLPGLPAGVRLRPVIAEDREALVAVYAATRAAELAQVPWTAVQRDAFVRSQHAAQESAYRSRYPDGQLLVVERDGAVVGRLTVAPLAGGDLRVVDLALGAGQTGRGLGTAVLRALLAWSDGQGLTVSLHVAHGNPARRLYARLGFVEVAADDVTARLERTARRQLKTAS
jgi:GNAT superfamily N-acetyltransferase